MHSIPTVLLAKLRHKTKCLCRRTPLLSSAVKFTWHKNHCALPSRATFKLRGHVSASEFFCTT